MDSRSDAELLAAHVGGDHGAFEEIVRRHKDRLWAVAVRTMGNREDAPRFVYCEDPDGHLIELLEQDADQVVAWLRPGLRQAERQLLRETIAPYIWRINGTHAA